MLPAAVTVAGPVFTTARSADAVTSVIAVELLLVGLGSVVTADTVTWLVRVVACGGAVTTRVMVGAVVPVATAGVVHVTDTFPTLVQVHPLPVAETNVTPSGRTSTTETFAASDGPRLETTSEYVTEPEAVTVGGPVLTTDRSADGVTVVIADDELLPGFGSAVGLDTVTLFVNVPACAGAVTTTVMGAVAPWPGSPGCRSPRCSRRSCRPSLFRPRRRR